MSRTIVTFETQHGSAKKLAQIIAGKLDALCINVDTPFQAEDESLIDNLILVFGFRGPYTAQLTKLYLSRMKGKLNYKNLILVGEGMFSEKEFPSVAEGIRTIAEPFSFHSYFMKGQLRVETLTQEEQAILGKFSKLTGMKIEDMGEFSEEAANAIGDSIKSLLTSLPVPKDPNADKKRWICTVCGNVHTGDTPPNTCPVCKRSGDIFKAMD